MDGSIHAMFPHDDHALGPFLGNLPPDIITEIVKMLGWFQTTFAMAGKTCREIVERVGTRAVLTEEDRYRFRCAGVDSARRRGGGRRRRGAGVADTAVLQ